MKILKRIFFLICALIFVSLFNLKFTEKLKESDNYFTVQNFAFAQGEGSGGSGTICYTQMIPFPGGRTLECNNSSCCYRADVHPLSGAPSSSCSGSFSDC